MNAAIIGAGLGGLSCAIRLQRAGYDVKIYEKNTRPGGRAAVLEEKGFRIDMGPTLVLMPEVLQSIFTDAGRDLSNYLTLKKLEPGYRIAFADGKEFLMTDDTEKLARQIHDFASDADPAFYRYRQDVKDKFEFSRASFIERNFDSVFDLFTLKSLHSAIKIKPFGSAYGHAYSYFKNHYLAAAFSCQTLYLGDSPFRVPSLYNLLGYLEFTHGVYYPEGGIGRIPEALRDLFLDLGGTIQYGAEVASVAVENGCVTGVRLVDGALELADVVVSNRDIGASYKFHVAPADRKSMPDSKIDKLRYGQSCAMFYLGLNKKVEGLMHHNILLSSDFKKSCHQIFEEGVLPDDPLLYVCSPTKTDPSLAPKGKDIVYILALAPNLKGKVDWAVDLAKFRKRVFERLAKSGVSIDRKDIELERHFTPEDFESRYGSLYGNAFGLGPDFLQSAAFRPSSRSKDVRGLYHVGASTHPGTGMPMVLMSGKLAGDRIQKEMAPRAVAC